LLLYQLLIELLLKSTATIFHKIDKTKDISSNLRKITDISNNRIRGV
jgi:hypothetical protein